MNCEEKTRLLGGIFLWVLVMGMFSLTAACGKAAHAFYHQVILEDQPVGLVKKN